MLFRHLSDGTEENSNLSGLPVLGRRFDTRICLTMTMMMMTMMLLREHYDVTLMESWDTDDRDLVLSRLLTT